MEAEGGNFDWPLITGNLDAVVETEADGWGSSLDGVVMVLAGVHHQLALDGPHAVLLVLGEELVSGHHEGVHVGDAAARGQDAVAALEADYLPHLLEDLVLHQYEDRRDLVGEHVGVGGGGEPLPCQGGDVQPAWQLVEKTRVACRQRE